MSTLYFCTFLHLYFCQTVHTNIYAKSGFSSSKYDRVMLNLVFSAVPLLLWSCLCLKASRQGHLLHRQISPVPDVPQILFTPQNVSLYQWINLKVAPTSQDSLGCSYRCRSRPQQIYSFCYSPYHSKNGLRTDRQTYTHTVLNVELHLTQ